MKLLKNVREVVEKRSPEKGEQLVKEKSLATLVDLEPNTVEHEKLGNLQVNWMDLMKSSLKTAQRLKHIFTSKMLTAGMPASSL